MHNEPLSCQVLAREMGMAEPGYRAVSPTFQPFDIDVDDIPDIPDLVSD